MRFMKPEETLALELRALVEEHRRLDTEAAELAGRATGGLVLELQRIKRRKLALKDRISVLQNRLTPDIIA